jgi:hypothetical protein
MLFSSPSIPTAECNGGNELNANVLDEGQVGMHAELREACKVSKLLRTANPGSLVVATKFPSIEETGYRRLQPRIIVVLVMMYYSSSICAVFTVY